LSGQKLNILMFSCEYDKALTALILANSAADIDMESAIFFSFWGLLILRNPDKGTLEDKNQYEKIFNKITPEGPKEIPLSKMNFSGFGKKMLKKMMSDNDAPSLLDFMKMAQENGVSFFACKLSLEVMGLNKEELTPEPEIMTAQDYLKNAASSRIQLFI